MSYYMSETTTYRFVVDTPEEAEKAYEQFRDEGIEFVDGMNVIVGTDIQVKLAEYETERGW
jgi:predicted nucleic acid-binding protein